MTIMQPVKVLSQMQVLGFESENQSNVVYQALYRQKSF